MVLAVSEKLELDFDVEGKGDAIVFIPGANDDRNGWAEVAPAFPNYKRVLFDNRDVGRSPRATAPYSVADMADDTIRMMDRAGIARAHVFGHSMGGLIAQEVALRAPERVQSLVLICTFAHVDEYLDSAFRRWMHWIQTLSAEEFLRNTLPYWVGSDIINEMGMDALVDLVRPQVEAQGAQAFCRQIEAILKHDTLSRLPQIAAPALVVAGDGDMIVRRNHEHALLDSIPKSRHVVIEHSGHSPTIEQPAALNAAIQGFLASR
jgi:pimeloyl-ACP methyl ester carboxylesterase